MYRNYGFSVTVFSPHSALWKGSARFGRPPFLVTERPPHGEPSSADGRRVCPRRGVGLRIWRSFRWRKLKHKGCNSATWSLNSPVAPKIHLKLEARRRRREACRAPSALSSGHSRRRVRKVPLRRMYIYPRPTSGLHVSPPKARTRVGHLVSVEVST